MERLSDRFRVIAVDAYGAGKSPDWPPGTPGWLDDELALLKPLFDNIEGQFHLAGHSYGAAIALKAALRNPSRVKSLAVYEPTLFSLLLAQDPRHPAAQGIRDAAEDAAAAIAQSMRGIGYWAHALFNEPTPLSAFAGLHVPVLYLVGGRSPASSRGVFGLLAKALPEARVVQFDELGHMGPVTHPDLVNEAVEQYLGA